MGYNPKYTPFISNHLIPGTCRLSNSPLSIVVWNESSKKTNLFIEHLQITCPKDQRAGTLQGFEPVARPLWGFRIRQV